MLSADIAAGIGAIGTALVSWSVLIICILVTRDHRRRRRFAAGITGRTCDELAEMFSTRLHLVAVYIQFPREGGVSDRAADLALVEATVLRERICLQSGVPLPSSYLAARRRLWRVAKNLPLAPDWVAALRQRKA